MGSPCFHLRSILKDSDLIPTCNTEADILLLKSLIQFTNFLPKPKNSKVLYINFQEIESKVFSKSININNPLIFFDSV